MSVPPTELDRYASLVQRFDGRARRLRSQANLLLVIIILVLSAGTAAFIFANYIANLNLHPQTAETQYEAAAAALKQREAQIAEIQSQIDKIANNFTAVKPYYDKLSDILKQLSETRDKILETCKNITYTAVFPEEAISSSIRRGQTVYLQQGETAATDRIGEFFIRTLDRTIYFQTRQDASQCRAGFNFIEEQIGQYFRKIQDTSRDADEAAANFAASKQAELAPLRARLTPLQEDDNRLNRLIANLQDRVTEERVLGTPLAPEQRGVSPNESTGKPDWPQVIQSNVTRIGAVLLTIFLMTILVPQYRYNIRLA